MEGDLATLSSEPSKVKTEQQLSLEMFHAAERLNEAIHDAQSVLGKPVYLEIASREGFVRVTPILHPIALFPSTS